VEDFVVHITVENENKDKAVRLKIENTTASGGVWKVTTTFEPAIPGGMDAAHKVEPYEGIASAILNMLSED
jgi:hypothetical protein